MVDHPTLPEFGPKPDQLRPDQVCELVEPLLFREQHKLGHNVKFDLLSTAKYYDNAIPPGPYDDTIIVRHTLAEDLGNYKLKDLVCDWFHIPLKQRPKFYPNIGKAGIDNFGLDEVARYLAKDVRYCWMMFQTFYPLLAMRGVLDTYDFEMSVTYPSVMKMEHAGFPVDISEMDGVRKDLEEEQSAIEQEAWSEVGGVKFELSLPNAKRWVLFGEVGKRWDDRKERNVPIVKQAFGTHSGSGKGKFPLKHFDLRVLSTTDTGLPQVTQTVLEHYADRGVRIAQLFLDWSEVEKLRGTFIEGLSGFLHHGKDGLPTLHTGFKIHGTVTGRLSSAEPNLQQLPRGQRKSASIRKLFVAGYGHALIVADYDQIELRCLAYAANEPAMIEIFRQHRDIHAEATAVAMLIDLSQVTSDLRQLGKTLNFATGYGAGPERIAAVAGVSKKRGQQFLDRYYREFSALEPWKRELLAEARSRCDMTDLNRYPPYVEIPISKRRRRLPDLMPLLAENRGALMRAERQAVNAYVQGFAANITKLAMRQLHEELADYPAQLLAQVHDEIVVRVEKDAEGEVTELMKRVMSGVQDTNGRPILGEIPLVVSAATGPSWAEAKK